MSPEFEEQVRDIVYDTINVLLADLVEKRRLPDPAEEARLVAAALVVSLVEAVKKGI
ncbi:MAG: hypothetical protein AB7W16_24465 [Candidatus Obscuribacterales bacterium]